ncbi:MAG: ATP-binding cassette domain-containing protein [Bacilli bacterium]|nr:ATP-binding cassette domain-containing protein [Bacilli bacterium]
METLLINSIFKSYDREVLNNINCKFFKGEIVSILGESGCGKSTLLNIIGGLDKDYKGEVLFEGNNIKDNTDLFRRKNVGFVFQNCNLIPYLNIMDNVALPLSFYNESFSLRRKKAFNILKKLGLENHLYKKPNEISGGQKQKVAIARALINNPKIVICDEPTGSLDSESTKEILNIFIDIAKMGKIIIIATHSNVVSSISHRIIRLKDGNIENEEILSDFIEYYEEKPVIRKSKKISLLSNILLSINNLKSKKLRTILISIGTSIGLIGLTVMLSLSNSVKKYINDIIGEVNSNNIVDIYNEKQDNVNVSKPFSGMQIDKIKENKLINNISFGYYNKDKFSLLYKENNYNFDTLKTYSSQMNKNLLVYGNFPKSNQVLVNNNFINKIKDNIIDNNIVFESNTYTVSGVYEDGMAEDIIYFIYEDIDNMYNIKPNILYLETSNSNKLKKEIVEEGYYLSYLEDSLIIFNDAFDLFKYILTFISLLSLIISIIMIMVTLYISVLERTKEIGILRAIGWSIKEVKKLFLFEGITYGIISSFISIVISFFLLLIGDKLLYNYFDLRTNSININYFIYIFIISMFMGLISSYLPSKKTSKINIIDSLRYE